MGTDFWSTEDTNPIVAWADIGFYTVYTGKTVTEGKPVELVASTTDGVIYVQNADGMGDAFQIALKDGAAGDMVPVAVHGVLKVVVEGDTPAAIVTGKYVMNSALCVISAATFKTTTACLFAGISYVLGIALQSSSAAGDEILILLQSV